MLSNHLTGQKKVYSYSNYRFPEVTVKGLDMQVDLSGNSNSSPSSSLDINTNSLSGNLSMGYFQFTNRSSLQKTDEIILPLNFYSFESDFNQSSTREFSGEVRKNQFRRNYQDDELRAGNLRGKFWELNHSISFGHRESNRKDQNQEISFSTSRLNLALQLKKGWGRIEPMGEVFLAQFIMDDLLEAGLISEPWSETQLFNLAATIATIQNVRVFDFRRGNIFRLTSINQWLAQQGVPQNISSFAILNDNLNFNVTNQRLEGKRISYGIQPWFRQLWNGNALGGGSSYGVGVEAEYLDVKNKNQYIQTEIKATLAQDLQFSDVIDSPENLTSLRLKYGVFYNPNSRTTYGLSFGADYLTRNYAEHAIYGVSNFNANYFINNRSRIRINMGINHRINNEGISLDRTIYSEFDQNFRLNQSATDNLNIINSGSGTRTNIFGFVSFLHNFF